MEDKKRSWDRHLSRLRQKGWAQSRQELEVVASKSGSPDDDSIDEVAFEYDAPGPDALDFVFETIEEYVCGHVPTRAQESGWDRDYASRGHSNESNTEVCVLRKLGEVQQRSSVADRIKALEANNAPTNTPRASNRSHIEPRSTSPVSRWKKATTPSPRSSWQKPQKSPGTPNSWQRPQMQKSPGSSNSWQKSPESPGAWQRPQMQKSPGSPNSWQRPHHSERSPGSLPDWVHSVDQSVETPHTDVPRSSNKVPVLPRNAHSGHGSKSSKQPIPTFPTKLKTSSRKPSRQDSVIARILKDSETESSGLSFVSYYEKEGIYVSKIRSTSKFIDTELERGMRVLRINGAKCPGRVKNVIKMLKSAKRVIEIEAITDDSIEFVGREKQTEDTKEEEPRRRSGRSKSPSKRSKSRSKRERKEESPEDTETSKADEMGFTDKMMLSIGYVPHKPQEEGQKPAQEESPIERKDSSASIASLDRSEIPEKPKNKKVHAMVFKKSRRDKIGISFVSFKKKRGVYVYEMYEDSKFQRTGLEVGMKVLAINRQPCPERVSETLALVKDIEGQLIITAVAPSDEPAEPERARADDARPKVQKLNKPGKERLRKYDRNYRGSVREEPPVNVSEILSRRDRREILENHSWMEDKYGDRRLSSSYSQDSQSTSSTNTEEQADDNGSDNGSLWSSIFG